VPHRVAIKAERAGEEEREAASTSLSVAQDTPMGEEVEKSVFVTPEGEVSLSWIALGYGGGDPLSLRMDRFWYAGGCQRGGVRVMASGW